MINAKIFAARDEEEKISTSAGCMPILEVSPTRGDCLDNRGGRPSGNVLYHRAALPQVVVKDHVTAKWSRCMGLAPPFGKLAYRRF